ncbi:MAG: tetratricopeptide (TPR) repeat protein [Planctomycetota bacterium]|jgi:tetratricopeptide (TPR) repeat protein
MSHNKNNSSARFSLVLPGMLGLVAFASCAITSEEITVQELFSEGNYVEASSLAREQAMAAPDDASAASMLTMTKVAVLLEKGREASYEGDLTRALGLFFTADSEAPGHPVVENWIEKTVGELTEQCMRSASETAALGELDLATRHYERALVFSPGLETAKSGISRMLLLANYRSGRSQSYYKDGLRSMRDFWLGQASGDFAANEKYAPGNEPGEARRKELAQLLAQDRLLMARSFEDEGLIHAARNEYRLALLVAPNNNFAAKSFARMERAVEASDALREADRKTTRGELDDAVGILKDGVKISPDMRPEFLAAMNEVVEARAARLYAEGLDLELDSDFEGAVGKYDELLLENGFYKDALSRRKTCLGFVELAERLYSEAKQAKGPAAQLNKLKQIAVFWPEYLDVEELLAKLEG